MRKYNTGVSSKVFASLVAVLVVTSVVVAIAIYFPGSGNGPDPPGPSSLGARTADFLNSMRDNVEFYFIANSSFVNQDLTDFYAQSEPTAFVDGVMMNRTESGGQIDVLFSPWTSGIIGSGAITPTQWNSLSGLIVDDGIGQMNESETTPDLGMGPLDLYFAMFFNDSTCFYLQYSSTSGLVQIYNGTWTGEFVDGWPVGGSTSDPYWLVEDGHLATAINALYATITSTVSYP